LDFSKTENFKMGISNQRKTKHTIKYLASSKNCGINRRILKASPIEVTKAICNAAHNIAVGEAPLSRSQKRLFARFRKQISLLIRKRSSVDSKRRYLIQSGGSILGILIPTLLTTALSIFGSRFLNKNADLQEAR